MLREFKSKKYFQFISILALLVLVPVTASARVFDFQNEYFSTYLRGTYGFTQLQREAYEPDFPPSVVFSGSGLVSQAYSGEFGFGIASPKSFNTRIGVELFSPANATGVLGNKSDGTNLLSLDSQVYSVIPQINLEIYLKKTSEYRIYFGGGVGYAVTTLKNTVTMTTSGSSTLGVPSYIEEGTGWSLMGQCFLGYEFSFFDNVSFSLDAGYRYLTVDNFKSNRDSVTPIGTVYTGNPLKNNDGSARTVNLSGLWAGATFRFWFQ